MELFDVVGEKRDTDTVVLAAGVDNRRGGASMRWEALRQALDTLAPTAIYRLTCNRLEGCRPTCPLTGTAQPPEFDGWYFLHAACEAYALRLVRELTRIGASTVVCSGLETFWYASWLSALGRFRVVFDMHNVEYPLNRSISRAGQADSSAYWTEFFSDEHVARVRTAEHEAITNADEVWVCSDDDQLQTLASYPDTPPEKIRVVPNVVDVAAFPPAVTTPRRACFTGRIDYPPNYLAARMIVRGLAPLLDDADSLPIVIAGRMAGELFADEPVPSNVTLVSNPRDVPAEVISGSIMVVPLTLGSGSRFKILEAFACGAPVVSTRKGAEGLAVEAGTHYLPAATAAEFAAAIKELRSDPRLRGRLTAAARELVEERYSVRSLTQQLRVVASDGRSG